MKIRFPFEAPQARKGPCTWHSQPRKPEAPRAPAEPAPAEGCYGPDGPTRPPAAPDAAGETQPSSTPSSRATMVPPRV